MNGKLTLTYLNYGSKSPHDLITLLGKKKDGRKSKKTKESRPKDGLAYYPISSRADLNLFDFFGWLEEDF